MILDIYDFLTNQNLIFCGHIHIFTFPQTKTNFYGQRSGVAAWINLSPWSIHTVFKQASVKGLVIATP